MANDIATLNEIAAAIAEKISAFCRCRVSTMQNAEQFLAELANIGADTLPLTLVVFESSSISQSVRDSQWQAVVIARYDAAAATQCGAGLDIGDAILGAFPAGGTTDPETGVCFLPGDGRIVNIDRRYSCYAFGVTAKQGI